LRVALRGFNAASRLRKLENLARPGSSGGILFQQLPKPGRTRVIELLSPSSRNSSAERRLDVIEFLDVALALGADPHRPMSLTVSAVR
jgi:hypothetical protein